MSVRWQGMRGTLTVPFAGASVALQRFARAGRHTRGLHLPAACSTVLHRVPAVWLGCTSNITACTFALLNVACIRYAEASAPACTHDLEAACPGCTNSTYADMSSACDNASSSRACLKASCVLAMGQRRAALLLCSGGGAESECCAAGLCTRVTAPACARGSEMLLPCTLPY